MAKRRIIWSLRANLDLYQILEFYYKRNGTKTYSGKLNTTIRNSIRLLEKHPEIGIHTDVKSIRNLIVMDFGIFYEIKSATIEIITIWDSRQNPEKLDLKK
jgi:plasmid stabilization system protein ParE